MSADRRRKDANWLVANETGDVWDTVRQGAMLATMMDIRDELKKLNSLLHCSNFTAIPFTLSGIKRNTTKPKKKRKVVVNG